MCTMSNAPKGRLVQIEARIAAALEDGRQAIGMGQQQLADLIGVSQSQVSRMLSGERPLTIPELLKMCDALHLDAATVIAQAEDA